MRLSYHINRDNFRFYHYPVLYRRVPYVRKDPSFADTSEVVCGQQYIKNQFNFHQGTNDAKSNSEHWRSVVFQSVFSVRVHLRSSAVPKIFMSCSCNSCNSWSTIHQRFPVFLCVLRVFAVRGVFSLVSACTEMVPRVRGISLRSTKVSRVPISFFSLRSSACICGSKISAAPICSSACFAPFVSFVFQKFGCRCASPRKSSEPVDDREFKAQGVQGRRLIWCELRTPAKPGTWSVRLFVTVRQNLFADGFSSATKSRKFMPPT